MLLLRRPPDTCYIERGSLVWAKVPDERGLNEKCRPVVVLTSTAQIKSLRKSIVVACGTTTPADENDPKFVFLTTSPRKESRLTEKTWINTTWLWIIEDDWIEAHDHRIDVKDLAAIMSKLNLGQQVNKAPKPRT